jgi:hypothetical protein
MNCELGRRFNVGRLAKERIHLIVAIVDNLKGRKVVYIVGWKLQRWSVILKAGQGIDGHPCKAASALSHPAILVSGVCSLASDPVKPLLTPDSTRRLAEPCPERHCYDFYPRRN